MLVGSRIFLFLFLCSLSAIAFGHGMSEAEKQSIIDGGLTAYLWLGATHMLTGYDHLLFVFGMVFLLSRFMDVVKYVTAFTVGHSITLIIATYNGIQVNYFLIDAFIALTVCYIAFVNINGFRKYLNIETPNLLATVFFIGLVHGLGLSTRLQSLPLQMDNLLMQIISFNVGIELGQIAALAAMLLLIRAIKTDSSQLPWRGLSSSALAFMGSILFLMQMHGYSHNSNPDEFVFSADQHAHEHMKMDAQRFEDLDFDRPTHHDSL